MTLSVVCPCIFFLNTSVTFSLAESMARVEKIRLKHVQDSIQTLRTFCFGNYLALNIRLKSVNLLY